MPRRKSAEPPSYRLHKQSGQAIVTLSDDAGHRRDVLLGPHGTPESRAEYARVIAEWETSGRRLPDKTTRGETPADVTVNELLLAYWKFAEGYYVKNGEPTAQIDRLRLAFRPLKELYGHTLARDFGPKALKAVRDQMLVMPCGRCEGQGKRVPGLTRRKKGKRRKGKDAPSIPPAEPRTCKACEGTGKKSLARTLINSCVGCIKRLFQWGVAEELVPADVFHGLQAVEGLKKGRSKARETEPIEPVDDKHVESVLPLVRPPVRAMVQLQRLTGMRPGEAVIMKPRDVDQSNGTTWRYVPESHKTEHHGKQRVIFLGPKAQEILKPFLDREPDAYCFSPKEATEAFRAEQRGNRKTKVQPSQKDRTKKRPLKKQPRDHYSVDTYGNAIERACRKAGIPTWHANQLRHTRATEIRRIAGLDAARAVLGHSNCDVTEVYAEVDADKAAEIMARIG